MDSPGIDFDLGLHASKFKTPSIPGTFMESTEASINFFNSEIKKCAPTVGQKLLSSITKIIGKKNGTLKKETESPEGLNNSKDERSDAQKRHDRLSGLFRSVYYRYMEAEKYFAGCSGIDVIAKYNKKIHTEYKRILKKGYINELNKNPGEKNLFPKEKYSLAFANPDSIPSEAFLESKAIQKVFLEQKIETLKFFPKFKENMNYKTRCELLYSYLQTFFSTCLSMINTIYRETLENKNLVDGLGAVQGTFNNAINAIEYSLKSFNECVEKVDAEVAKHKFYFSTGDNKKGMREVNRSIKRTRQCLETMLSTGRRLNLNARFVFLGDEEKQAYENLVGVLININDNLNQMAKYISKGNYDELERNYKQIVEYFKSLPVFVEKFKNSKSYKVSAPAKEELKRYKTSIEKLAEDAENVNTKIIAFTKEFEVEYKEFKEKTIKLGVISTFRGMAKFVALFVPFVSVVNSTFDSFMTDFKILCKSTRSTGIQK